MPTTNPLISARVKSVSKPWFVTGVAGFIGSHLLEHLLLMDQEVVGVDNLSTGSKRNLDDVKSRVQDQKWERFHFIEADVNDSECYREALTGCGVVLHQAALGSVPRSIREPLVSNRANIDGFLTLLEASRELGVKRFVYASSSSVYGSSEELPKVEGNTGHPLSPYAVTKATNEMYGEVYRNIHGMEVVGLRYFNVFGPRQDPEGPYAAVIPRWIETLLRGQTCVIYGDGATSRDFCYVDNVVEANLLAAIFDYGTQAGSESLPQGSSPACGRVHPMVVNVALGSRITLSRLHDEIASRVESIALKGTAAPRFEGFRSGDIAHSQADISFARELLGYRAKWSVAEGLDETVRWFHRRLQQA